MTAQLILAFLTSSALIATLYCIAAMVAWLAFIVREAGAVSRPTDVTERYLASWLCRHVPCPGSDRR
ncbi:MAG: hypothetical protein MI824_19720 [Hyphomicrobiales bacterium]|nr:hypothetical protein [Hyphomicrobiales bacterium]